jgi:hypothetical protein
LLVLERELTGWFTSKSGDREYAKLEMDSDLSLSLRAFSPLELPRRDG